MPRDNTMTSDSLLKSIAGVGGLLSYLWDHFKFSMAHVRIHYINVKRSDNICISSKTKFKKTREEKFTENNISIVLSDYLDFSLV